MKRIVIILFATFCLLLQLPLQTFAAPSDQEVETYLDEIGWTEYDLQQYLDFYHVKLADFRDIEQLKSELGTPITKENLHDLLQSYDITEEELEIMLARFGEKIQDYTFLEDLDIAVDFYLTHEEEVARAEDFFVSMGFEQEEAHKIFQHLLRLNNSHLTAKLSEIKESPNWSNLLHTFQVNVEFYTQDETNGLNRISRDEITEASNVIARFYNEEQELIATATLPENVLSENFLSNASEELVHVAQVAMELSSELFGSRMPDTATTYPQNLLTGFAFLLASFFFLKK
ncbi:processed acidic surface protein [Bacillus sp. FJAT-45066]|uniref:processed acidic surface protein n=1 Tax=Bacillus sp. FJAT-45066 TaxID=2011010 RepID=UPI001596882F|nr:processed acidic surface protein [Bacillus sp. FJAT-45066]